MRPRRNTGHILTVKLLPKRSYMAIHSLPRGFRNASLIALLNAAADLAETDANWYKRAVANGLRVRAL